MNRYLGVCFIVFSSVWLVRIFRDKNKFDNYAFGFVRDVSAIILLLFLGLILLFNPSAINW